MRPSHLSFTILGFLVAACGSVPAAPGEDFRVQLLSQSPLQVFQKVEPVAISFQVTGCDAFDVAFGDTRNAQNGVYFAQTGDHTYTALVPVDLMRVWGDTCLDDSVHPLASRARLLVTCHDSNRTASVEFDVNYETANRVLTLRDLGTEPGVNNGALSPFNFFPPLKPGWDPVSALFPSGDPLHPFWISGATTTAPSHLSGVPLGPVFAQSGASAAESVGCTRGLCNETTFVQADGGAQELQASEVALWSNHLDPKAIPASRAASVPANVIDLAYLSGGTLAVLSQVRRSTGSATVVTLVSEGTSIAPTLIASFEDEEVATRFSKMGDGRLAFATVSFSESSDRTTLTLNHATLHTVTTASVDSKEMHLPTQPSRWGDLSLSPDGTTLVVRGDKTFIGAPDGPWTELIAPHDDVPRAPDDQRGVVWLSQQVALWRGGAQTMSYSPGVVETFDLAPPHSFRMRYFATPPADHVRNEQLDIRILDVTAAADHLVLTTRTGIRILDGDGHVIAGSDPLPCAFTTTSSARAVGPSTVGVGAGTNIYLFDIPN